MGAAMRTRTKSIVKSALVASGAAVAAAIAVPGSAHACAVCFGAVDAPITHGLNNGILVLLGVIGAVQIGFVGLFVSIRRRAHRLDAGGSQADVLRPSNGGNR